jgi:F-type H+-transporting ATPase subunit delta
MADFRASERYAQSLMDMAIEQNNVETIQQEMLLIGKTMTESKDLSALMHSPVIKGDVKEKVLFQVFTELTPLTSLFLQLIVKKGREHYLSGIANSFQMLYRRREGIVTAVLITPEPASETFQAEIKAKLEAEIGRKVELTQQTDPALIGGFTLRVGDREVNTSVVQQLNALKKELITDDYVQQF